MHKLQPISIGIIHICTIPLKRELQLITPSANCGHCSFFLEPQGDGYTKNI